MSQNPRIEELRRRVQADPASIAFAALAEEYRREGNFTDAIDTCVAGLKRHPSYLSAHVTLGRSLIEVGRFEEAEQELQLVLRAAPENLAAIRGMAEIHHRRRDLGYDEASALSALQHHEHEQVAPVIAAAPAVPEPAAALPVEPPAYEPAPFEPARFEPAAHEPAAYVAPAFEPAAYEPPSTAAFSPAAYEPPRHDPPQYEAPRYDPPGTFEFPAVSPAPAFDASRLDFPSEPAAYDLAAYETIAYDQPPAAEHRNPQLDALERFLDAVLASRTAIPAH